MFEKLCLETIGVLRPGAGNSNAAGQGICSIVYMYFSGSLWILRMHFNGFQGGQSLARVLHCRDAVLLLVDVDTRQKSPPLPLLPTLGSHQDQTC
jgi:hypothetical protein